MSGEISLQTQTTVELNKKLKAAIRVIDKKLKNLGQDSTVTFRTNGTFKYNENDSNNINIHNCVYLDYLIKALSMVQRVKRETEQLCREEGIDTYPVITWCGYPVDAWIHDIHYCMHRLYNKKSIDELTIAKTELSAHLSQEDKLHATLTKVASLLK